MRALLKSGLTAAMAMGLAAGPLVMGRTLTDPRPVDRDPEPRLRGRRAKKEQRRAEAKRHDPYYGIASSGRTGATRRARLQAAEFARTSVGRRNARGRGTGTVFKSPAKEQAFQVALAAGESRNAALRIGRRAK